MWRKLQKNYENVEKQMPVENGECTGYNKEKNTQKEGFKENTELKQKTTQRRRAIRWKDWQYRS